MAIACSRSLENSRLSLPEKARITEKFVFHLTQTNLHAHYINKITNHLIADLTLSTDQRTS